MEDLIKEMEEYREHLVDRIKEDTGKLKLAKLWIHRTAAREYVKLLVSGRKSVWLNVILLDSQIEKLKEVSEREKEA